MFLFITHFGWQSFCLLNTLRNLPVAQRPGSQQKHKSLLGRFWLKKQGNWNWNSSMVSCFPTKVSDFWSLPGPLHIRRYLLPVLVDIKRKVGIRYVQDKERTRRKNITTRPTTITVLGLDYFPTFVYWFTVADLYRFFFPTISLLYSQISFCSSFFLHLPFLYTVSFFVLFFRPEACAVQQFFSLAFQSYRYTQTDKSMYLRRQI